MRLKPVLLAVCLSCAPLAVYGEQTGDALLQSLYVKSGLQVQVQQIPFSVRQAFDQKVASDQTMKGLSSKVIGAVRAGLEAVFVPTTMKATILREIRTHLGADDIRAALVWLDSSLGTKIAKLEEAASSPDFIRELPQFIERTRRAPPPQNRLNAIGRLDRAVGATDISVEVFIASTIASAVAISSIGPQDKRLSIPDLRSAMEKSRPMINKMLNEQVKVAFLYTYVSLPDSDLDRYLAFAESDVGRRYHHVVGSSLAKALLNSIQDLESAIDNELKARKI